MDTLPQRGFSAGRQWVATPTTQASTPKGLNVIAVCVLAIALLVLVAFVMYIVRSAQRARTAAGRWKRGRNAPAVPLVEAELVLDDPRGRGGRAGPRRNLPAMLLDRVRDLSLGSTLGGLWRNSTPEPVEKEVEEPDVVQYSSGRHSGAGPRVLAATASGKALQVVVKTAAVPARQQKQQPQLQEQRSAPMPSPTNSLIVTDRDATPGTPVQRHESRALDFIGAPSPPYAIGAGPGAPSAGLTVGSGSDGPAGAGAGLGIGDAGSTAAEGTGPGAASGVLAPGVRPFRHTQSDGPRTGSNLHLQAMATMNGMGGPAGSVVGTPLSIVAGGGAAGAGGGGGAPGGAGAAAPGRGPADVNAADPAAAWYSRALHRQVAATGLAVTQIAAAGPKAHLA